MFQFQEAEDFLAQEGEAPESERAEVLAGRQRGRCVRPETERTSQRQARVYRRTEGTRAGVVENSPARYITSRSSHVYEVSTCYFLAGFFCTD